MQNCLQSNKTLRKGACLIVLSALAILSMLLVFALFGRYNKAPVAYAGEEVYTGSLFATLPVTTEKTNVEYTANSKKMNNSNKENAKSGIFDAKTSRECINVRVLYDDNRIFTMELEDYVEGCVLGEMPLSFEPQALMVQAVAVRTFTVRQMSGNSKHQNADVCTDSACCQSYLDKNSKKISEENLRKLKDAVCATKGIIMTYDGEPIEAVYHASSGEYTLNSEDVWGGKVEYLRSVPSPEGEAELASVVYGHRVGMSQHGANLLATEGKGYTEILKYYYKGIAFDFLV